MERHPAGDAQANAGLVRRAVALLIDNVVLSVVLAVLLAAAAFVLPPTGPPADPAAAPVLALSAFGLPVYFAYFVALEAIYGYTPGKALLGLVVVTEDGGAVGWGQSVVRNLLRIVDGLPGTLYLVGAVAIVLTATEQRVGDLTASTLVVERA